MPEKSECKKWQIWGMFGTIEYLCTLLGTIEYFWVLHTVNYPPSTKSLHFLLSLLKSLLLTQLNLKKWWGATPSSQTAYIQHSYLFRKKILLKLLFVCEKIWENNCFLFSQRRSSEKYFQATRKLFFSVQLTSMVGEANEHLDQIWMVSFLSQMQWIFLKWRSIITLGY